MPIDSTNYGREIKSLRAEVSNLKNEFVKMQSAFQDVQEQYGYAFIEIKNLIQALGTEIKNNFEQNKTELQDEQFQNILDLTKKIDNANEGLTENLSQSLLNILSENESQSARQVEQKNLLSEKFIQLEKISDVQQINLKMYFDTIENSLAAQQKMFEEIFTRQNSEMDEKFASVEKNISEKILGVGENYSILQKSLAKFSSEVDEVITENQKTLLKKIESVSGNRKEIFKTLNAFEEMLRLIAANQLLTNIQAEIPTKNQNTSQNISSQENFSSNSYSSIKKSISIYGRVHAGKSTLADILRNKYSQCEISEIANIDRYELKRNYIEPNLAIFVIDSGSISYNGTQNFCNICDIAQKVLIVVNAKLDYELDRNPFSRRRQVENYFKNYSYALKNILDMFRSRCPYGIDWNKISVAYVNLKAAQIASRYPQDSELLKVSNFSEIEYFINAV